MPPPDKKSPETVQQQPTEQSPGTATPEQIEADTRGKTRLDINQIRKEIEEGHNKAETLKEKAHTLTNSPVDWTTAQPQQMEGFMDSAFSTAADVAINRGITEKSLSALTELGLNDEASIRTIKALAKEIITEHYTKTGKSQMNTLNYMRGEFKENLKAVAEKLKEFYETNKDKIPNPKLALEMMGEFTGINFFKDGKIVPGELKRLLLLKKENLDQLVEGFKEYFPLKQKLESLSQQQTSAMDENTPIEELVKTTKLKQPVRITVTNPETQKEEIKKLIKAQLPDSLKPELQEKYAEWAIEQLKLKIPEQTQSPEIRDLATDGTWSEAISPEQLAKEEAAKAAANQPQAEEVPADEEFKTGIGLIDNILSFIKTFSPGLYGSIVGFFKGTTSQSTEAFPNLDTQEKNNAKALQAATKKIGLNIESLKKLFSDSENLKKVLAQKKQDKLEWDEYLKKYLTDSEVTELKKANNSATDSGEKIAKIFLSKNPDYQPPSAPNQTPPANPPTASETASPSETPPSS